MTAELTNPAARTLCLCALVPLCLLLAPSASAGEASFSTKPSATKAGDVVKITFTISAPTDVEVAVLAADGKVVRHLAAGVLGAKNPPPEPLKPGLSQALEWDGKDDFGKPAAGTAKIRVRAGTGVKFGRFIGAENCNFGAIDGVVADEDGNVYLKGFGGEANQAAMCVRAFDSDGRYLREILPFPADLPPDAMKDVARWDAERKAFCPRNLKNLNPEFYVPNRGGNLNMVSASKKTGVVFTDGGTLYTIETSGAVRAGAFASRGLGGVKNSGGGPAMLAISPDGKWAYLSGPFSDTNRYGYVFDPKFPPGRVYRAPLTGAGGLAEFVTIPVDHQNGVGGAWVKACGAIGHFTVPHGAIHGVAVDEKGNVYVADREHGCVAVFDESGKEIGKIAVKNPHLIAVHPKTGAIYVTQYDCLAYGTFQCVVHKFADYKEGAKPVAKYEFPAGGGNRNQSMALAAGKDKTILWMAVGGLVPLEDKGASFEPLKIQFGPKTSVPADWNRLATDYDRDEVYISNGTTRIWRYQGATGEGGVLKKDGREFLANDLAVGYDGLLYTRVSGKWDGSAADYSGPFWRLDHELKPAPYAASGTHVLSPYIYSRFGIGFAERGIGVGPDGKCYLGFMYKWVAYAIAGFGPDGKPMKGKYLEGVFPGGGKYPPDLKTAIIGPVPQASANIRVDLKGDIYVGLMHRPKGFAPPKGFEKDQGYRLSVGSVVRFGPEGGSMAGSDGATTVGEMEGAKGAYPGLAPFSFSAEAFGGNTCCVCRVPRFDLDRFGRVIMPNAITNSVLLYDNAGNLILEFGKYGNFDSQFVNENLEPGKANGSTSSPPGALSPSKGKPTVAVPDIPMCWPTGAGFTEKAFYVCDTYNRRAMRIEKVYAAEETCEVK
jgi:sugar lactone lactonase YvrE